jgi:hypothetical protein
MKYKYLFILILILLILLPLGVLTEYPAWGEWDLSYYQKVLGFIPEKMKTTFEIPAVFPDYSLKGINPVISHYVSAIVGVGLIFLTFYGFYKLKK